MASRMGIEVYKDTTWRLHGYGSVLLLVKSPAWMHLMSSRLFYRCAWTFFSIGLRALASNHEMRWSIEVRYDGPYFNFWAGFAGLNEMVELGQIGI